jgi:hypothetical protein
MRKGKNFAHGTPMLFYHQIIRNKSIYDDIYLGVGRHRRMPPFFGQIT